MIISPIVARRYVLGRQGLWPGRRVAGKDGVATIIRQIGAVQIDPINVAARSHDIVLWGRVADYRPEQLDTLLYQDRAFFDYGGGLEVYPIEELPYWRMHMRRKVLEPRWATFATQNPALLDEVRAELRARGPLGNRDFEGRSRVQNYRARKDSGLALYYLWLAGELMTHHRVHFERVYGFWADVVPPDLSGAATDEQAEAFFARKALGGLGLRTEREWAASFASMIERKVSRDEARRWLAELVANGEAATVQVEGRKEPCYVPGADLPLMTVLANGTVPPAWQPPDATTTDEVVFLAPLDIVSARGRAKILFDFDYIWEVYKPAERRRWGYYVLPILFGNDLVGRIDPRLDRKTATLLLQGFWLENESTATDPAFVVALARGLARFADFVGARRIDIAKIEPDALRKQLREAGDTFAIDHSETRP